MNNFKTKIILFIVLTIFLFSPSNAYSRDVYICYDKKIDIGQTMDTVRTTLGEPYQIEQNEPVDENDQSVQDQVTDQTESKAVMSKWIYKCDLRTYRFIFQDETLINILLINEPTAETPDQ
jgi:hypothetical protein